VKPFLIVYGILCLLVPTVGYAAIAGSIINVSHGFRMKEAEPPPPRDFYLDLGSRDGVKAGDVLQVTRQISIGNAMWSGPTHLLRVVLGEVQILTVGETASIARVQSQRAASELPTLDYSTFMVGDSVEAKTAAIN